MSCAVGLVVRVSEGDTLREWVPLCVGVGVRLDVRLMVWRAVRDWGEAVPVTDQLSVRVEVTVSEAVRLSRLCDRVAVKENVLTVGLSAL